MKNIEQTDLIKDHTVDIYDSSVEVAESLHVLAPRRVALYVRGELNAAATDGILVHEHTASTAASLTTADVCLLDGSALKVLAVRYPSDAHYILARLTVRSSWFLGLPGLLRRLLLGRVRLGGIVSIRDTRGRRSYWLVIHRTKKMVKTPPLLLPKSVGIQTFLEWLRSEEIQYVVPRFYESLPELHRDNGDLDLLIADEDVIRVETYLLNLSNELTGTSADSVQIGMHAITSNKGVPYYPPPLARRIIANAIDGPAGSRIPEAHDALNALVYHALYHHKGYATNIPSNLGGRPEHPPENDYGGIIKRKAAELGVDVGSTMEDMDEYMASIGWRPKRDTLAKIAEKNMWVRDRFFSETNAGSSGLAVFVVKELALERGLLPDIVHHLKENGLTVIESTVLSEEQKRRATDDIRGGNWAGPDGSTAGLLPAAIIVAVDPQCAQLPAAYANEYERVRVKKRKEKVRKAFDQAGEASLVHSADNTVEAWDYIEVCFPEKRSALEAKAETAARRTLWLRVKRLCSPTYLSNTTRFALRDLVTKRLL
ncbi:hypothetical protein H6783_02125 [Candidatus Nomurabacteria bacterium]|nr:hypothetical protein [Candidatus Nomurabacteria bacterium]